MFIARPSLLWAGHLLTGLLFSSITWCLLRMIPWLQGPAPSGAALDTRGALRLFLWTSLAFLLLFVADILVSSMPMPSWGSWVDGSSLPLYLLLLSVGSIAFAQSALNAPALFFSSCCFS